MTPRTVVVPAYAKINRDLRIVGRDADGFHLLSTVYETVALHDDVTVARSEGPLRMTCSDPSLPVDDRNLVVRAVTGWCAARGLSTDGFSVHLEKRIPTQAGLGGGSADAAATLIGLTMLDGALTEPADARDALTEADRALAASLGVDVAFFLVGGRALGRRRGDEVMPLPDVASSPVLLLRPDFGISTAEAYRWFIESTGVQPGQAWSRRVGVQPGDICATSNDLQPPIARRFPQILEMVLWLNHRHARQAAMTGSGSVVFGVFDNESDRDQAAKEVPAAWRSWSTRTLSRADAWAVGV